MNAAAEAAEERSKWGLGLRAGFADDFLKDRVLEGHILGFGLGF